MKVTYFSFCCFALLSIEFISAEVDNDGLQFVHFYEKYNQALLEKHSDTILEVNDDDFNFTLALKIAQSSVPTDVSCKSIDQNQCTKMVGLAKRSLFQTFDNCDQNLKRFSLCYQIQTMFIRTDLQSEFGGNWIISVGSLDRYYMILTYATQYFSVQIGEFYFVMERHN